MLNIEKRADTFSRVVCFFVSQMKISIDEEMGGLYH